MGIARSTNAIYREMFPDGRPTGNRDQWQTAQQEDIMIAEITARREMSCQTEKGAEKSQREVNLRLVDASAEGASKARGFLNWLGSAE